MSFYQPARRVAIVAGVRTPFAKAGTSLKGYSAIELGKIAVSELIQRSELDPALIELLVFGTVIPYTMLVAGSPRIGLGASSVTGMIEPVAASIVAWVALNQRLTVVQVFGVLVALGGVTVAELARNRTPRDEHFGLVDAAMPP